HKKTLGVPRKINIFVDRLLLFGFLEELSSFGIDAINDVAQEMSAELTGSLNSKKLESTEGVQPLVVNSSENVENIKDVLREVEEILESSIKQKVKMARYVDKLLKQKNRQFAQEQIKTETEQYLSKD
ncbi:MAG: general secretion pathway protein GspA, partial [Colwellia sp.]|nr:general secretion pathway protein GspA [Colwellia sp.]